MAYTALARKYRSRTLDEVIGQKPIATTLANAIRAGRIHHGYLFTGTRGVGKTSVARILAKCLNCLAVNEPTVSPCCQCASCTAIAEGQDLDVVEIDAASNTGVDNIRELRSNAAFRPARARFKIYIIDEVHMLSTGAFNALLKTLEEPPGHVKFILATTELQKVPATIQSRCQRFNFRNITPAEIAARLADVARAEGAAADDGVLRRVARLAGGSMRDALSILDQLLAVSPTELSLAVLEEILPPSQDEQLLSLMTRIADGDAAGALRVADEVLSGGRGLEPFCSDTIDLARSLLLLRACGDDSDVVDLPAGDREAYRALCRRFDLSHYVQMISLLEELRRNARFSAAGRALADAAIVRLARLREWESIESLLSRAGEDEKKNLTHPPADAATRRADPQATKAAAERAQPPAPVRAARPGAQQRAESGREHASVSAPAERREPVVAPLPARDRAEADEPQRVAATGGNDLRSAAQRDPVVQKVLDLFEGSLVNIEAPSDAARPLES